MKRYVLPTLYMLVLSLLLANCIKEIDYQTDIVSDELVVSGFLSDQPGYHKVVLTRPGNYNRRVFYAVDGASVRVRDDLGQIFPYVQNLFPFDTGVYYCNLVQPEIGRTYTLEINLPNGEQYVSSPQTMLSPIQIDSVTAKGGYQEFVTAAQVVVDERGCEVYAHTTAPANSSDRFLRWESESVHIFDELPKIYYPIPPPQKQCFITSTVSSQLVAIADPSLYAPGASIQSQAGWRRIDNAFEHRICFTVYQRTINKEAYDYWYKIRQLLAINGTIFDAPPGVVKGNIRNINNPDKPARGFFEVASVTIARRYLGNLTLGEEFQYAEPYCDYDYRYFPPVNHPECDNCLLLKNSTTTVPEWWQ
ncbi:MAG: DUF4249 domain-containing protein [Saprospiraceae bacterium]|nr:DUF4249 domain-containing protein [Saprospiraceae bacterium]